MQTEQYELNAPIKLNKPNPDNKHRPGWALNTICAIQTVSSWFPLIAFWTTWK